jgi:hypothetical protein
MKKTVSKLAEDAIRQTHPISGPVPGWFFRCREQSNNVWHAEGTDLWGRTVSATDHDYDRLLQHVFKAAEGINAQLAARGG